MSRISGIGTRVPVLFVAVLMTIPLAARRVYIHGHISDENGNPVELVTVNEDRTMQSTMSNLLGNYSLSVTTLDDTVRLTFRLIGHETRKRVFASPPDTVNLNIMLPTSRYSLEGVEITGTRRQTGGIQHIGAEGLRFNADPGGGSVESIIATQAGVSSHNELSSQYNVRGGNFDENSVYVNGAEIMRPLLVRAGQQEGLSFINPDMVESIGFSTGGFNVSYGDKMSSVLDITYRKPKEFESVLTASLLGGSAFVGAGNNRISFAGSIRYKTTSYLLGTLDTKGEYDPSFFDFQTYISYTPNSKWSVGIIGNISLNNYNFTPQTRSTTFGTSESPRRFTVYFDGWESDRFNTMTAAMDIKRKITDNSALQLNMSVFSSRESETFDIMSQYWLDQNSVGTFLQHARNRLESDVLTVSLKGVHRTDAAGSVGWGIEYRRESIADRMREWEMQDSAGYTLPYTQSGPLKMYYSMKSANDMASNRTSAYIQDTWRFSFNAGLLTLNTGVRGAYWDWNRELIVSPRLIAGFTPAFSEDLTFRFSTGVYFQSPFYKEMKDTVNTGGIGVVMLNRDIRSQRSLQVVLGGDYDFTVFDRPFRFTAEAYYKKLDRLIPYNLDNVRIVYYGENCARGYAAGIDLKLFGEFVPGTQSWFTFSVMNTKEKIGGQWVPRPSDQRYNFSLYFTDSFPRRDRWRMSLRGSLADGLPFGPTRKGRESRLFRASAYKRVDIGLSYKAIDGTALPHYYGRKAPFKSMWIGLDCFNLLGINNVNSYYWVTDVTGDQYAVPNYLTGRQLNLRLIITH